MKINNSLRKFVPSLVLIVFAMVAGSGKVRPSTSGEWSTCPDSGCLFDIRNTEDNGNGSLRLALDEGCRRPGNHIIQFSRFPAAVNVIKIKSQLNILNNCTGTFQIAGMQSKEVIIDGSDIPRNPGNTNPDGKNCALYVGTGNHNIHHLTFVGAPNAMCVYGDNVKITDNNFGIKRDGTVQANVNGLFINRNQAQVLNNVFAGNEGDGLILQGHQNLVQRNWFGVTASDMSTNNGNGGAGIRLIDSASQNDIGYSVFGDNACQGDCSPTSPTPQSNIIKFNKKGGVVLAGTPESTRNVISGNLITSNVGLGIDLNNDGVSLPAPGLTGPNNMMPMATQVSTFPLEMSNPSNWYISFKAPLHAFYEIYKIGDNDSTDTNQLDSAGKSYGEGSQLLARGQANVLSSTGFAGVPLASGSLLQIHNKISILLRDEQGNTSEFSSNIEVSDTPQPPPTAGGCGDGVISGDEKCDDGPNNGTANSCCKADCTFQTAGNDCTTGGMPGTCAGTSDTCNPKCGNGTPDSGEQCDDGVNNGTPNSCCKSDCTLQPAGTACTGGVCAGSTDTCNPSTCGNGMPDVGEQCDDGANNGTPNSCCKSDCTLQPAGTACTGGVCAGSTDTCTPSTCGNGTVDMGETCDDGNTIPGDGCDAACQKEPGYTCTGTPSVCTTTCGDGVKAGTEQCDDGNTNDNDGCSGTCTTEPGWTCTGTPSVCTTTCGDGIKTGTEQCDDGNTTAGDGCDGSCNTEPGWTCTGTTPSVCTHNPVCGNGSVETGEGCDDGNTANGDGCSSTCTVEPGYTCTGSPSVCNPSTGTCGNNITEGTEQCDGGACCNPGTCTIKTDGTVCNDAGGTCLAGVCTNTNPGGGVVPPGFTGPMSIEGGGFCSLTVGAGDSNALVMVVLDFIGAASIGLFRIRRSQKK